MDFNQKLEFIEEIKEHSELYDKDNPHFHDYHKKEQIWNLIGEKFNIAEPKKKWATLRDKFVRLKRLRETTPSSENNPYAAEKWNLYQPLAFLNDFCRHRKRSTFRFTGDPYISHNTKFLEQTPVLKKVKSEKTAKLKRKLSSFASPCDNNYEFTESFNSDNEHSKCDENQEIENEFFPESNSEYNESTIKKEILENEKNCSEDFINSKLNNETENYLFIKMIGKKLELLSTREKNKIQIQILQLVNEELDKYDC